MRSSSIRHCCCALLAAMILSAATEAPARTLTLSVARVDDPNASAADVRVRFEQNAAGGSLEISAAQLDVPQLAIAGRIDWRCALEHDNASWACAGPVRVVGSDGRSADAVLGAQIAGDTLALTLARDHAKITLALPFATTGAAEASLKQVPASWLKGVIGVAWPGGEIRNGVFDLDAKRAGDGRITGEYRASDATLNTRDGTVSARDLNAAGRFEWSRDDDDSHVLVEATLHGGALAIGSTDVLLPDADVALKLDALVHGDGRWDITRFAWDDSDALAFRASGTFMPAALAPLRALDLTIERAELPLAQQRYAAALLRAQGLVPPALRGRVSGELAIDAAGVQRIALASKRLDLRDAEDRFAFSGIHGSVDWSATGTRPQTTIAWGSARIGDLRLPATSSRWRARDGALSLVGALRTKIFGGELKLKDTTWHPLAQSGERLRSTFAVSDLQHDSADGTNGFAHLTGQGELRVSADAQQTRIQIATDVHGGEVLLGPVYLDLPKSTIAASLDATLANGLWRVGKFTWSDPGVLDVLAQAEIALSDPQPLKSLRLDLHNATLDPALKRYAHSWLASKGYGELTADGRVSGALQWNAEGMQRVAFSAHAVELRDGAGRFSVSGLDGGIDWNRSARTPPSALSWSSAEFYRIPLGSAQAQFESRDGEILLAHALAIDILGGKLRLEKLSLQPGSARGERYGASFAIVGIDMAQLSSALGWPRFGGNLSGGIPEIVWAGDRIDLAGGLDLYVFDGHLGVSGLTLERPFGVAPALGADVHFERLDLDQVTQAFSFGGMTGRLNGTIANLRLLDWSPVAFDAWLRTSGGGRMSYNAVNDLTSIGGGGGLSANLQTMALKLFNTFGYRELGIRCKLRDEVCAMSGIDPPRASDSAADGYTIVAGSGVPRIDIVGHGRRVDWPTLVRRLKEATEGQAPEIR